MKTLFVLIALAIASTSSSALAYEKWSETPTALKIEIASAKEKAASLERRLKMANDDLGVCQGKILDKESEVRHANSLERDALEIASGAVKDKQRADQKLAYNESMKQIGWTLFFIAMIFAAISRWWYQRKMPKQDARRPQS